VKDFFNECYDNKARRLGSPEAFGQAFCRRCRNQDCRRAGKGRTEWLQRVLTQEERLLRNPNFADPNDPAFEEIRRLPFKDMFREAVRQEIADIRQDWEPVTGADVAAFAQGAFQNRTPEAFQTAPEDVEVPASEDDEIVIEWEVRIKGSSPRTTYDVTLGGLAGRPPVWSCPCKGFQYGGGAPCKHIQQAKKAYARSRQFEPENEVEPSVPRVPPPRHPRKFPKAGNTQTPPGGLMVGGGPVPPQEPETDPWAVPEPKGRVIPVGGRVRMGLKSGDKKDD